MAISGQVLAGVTEGYKKKALDGNFAAVPLIDKWKAAGGLKQGSGRNIVCPVQVAEHSSITDLISGRENIALTVQDNLKRLVFDWSRSAGRIIVSGKDKDEYESDMAMINYVQTLTKNVYDTMLRAINKRILLGTGQGFSELVSFNGADVGGGGATTNIFRPQSFGSQTGVLGTLNRALFGNALQHQLQTASDDFSVNGRSQLSKVVRACQRQSVGGVYPHLILMSDAGFNNLFDTIVSNERFSKEGQLVMTGPRDIQFMSVPVCFDPDMPTSATVLEEYTAYVLNLEGGLTLEYIKWMELGAWSNLLAAGIDGEGCSLISEIGLGVQHLPSSGVLVDGNTN